MISISLAIITATAIFLLFRTFKNFDLDTFHAIVINYIVAAVLGYLIDDSGIEFKTIFVQKWFYMSFFIGLLFISVLNLIAITSQKVGVSVASVATKMSVVIPIVLGFFFYKENMGVTKIIGIVLALASVYLTSQKDEKIAFRIQSLILPALLFFIGGSVDALFQFTQANFVESGQEMIFTTALFACSAIMGIGITFFKKNPIYYVNRKSFIAGVALGIPNFASIYFLMKALDSGLESSLVFPIINMGVVVLSTILSFLIFKEKLNYKNWLGISLSLVALFLLVILPVLLN